MPKLLLSVIICLLSSIGLAQQENWLAEEALQQLDSIYCAEPIHVTNLDLESIYISAYNNFICYQAFERKNDANSFYSGYAKYSEACDLSNKDQLMLVNLSIQKALLLWMQGEEFEGARVFYKAHRIFKRIEATNFGLEHKKLQALFDIFLAQIPEQHQFFASLFGLEGDAEEGFSQLNQYLIEVKEEPGLYLEALVLYGYCQLKFGEPTEQNVVDYMACSEKCNSPIIAFIASSLALKNRLGEMALRLCADLPNAHYHKFPLLFYQKGRVLLNALDSTSISAFARFHEQYKGHSFKVDALMREAWYNHIKGEEAARDKAISKAKEQTIWPTSIDKQAKVELLTIHEEPVGLLKARLLYDGGYYSAAMHIINQTDCSLLSKYYQAEFYYRSARIFQAIGRTEEAITQYKATVALCKADERYIGPYAAIELVKYYTMNDHIEEAIEYLDSAVQLNTGQYKSDIQNILEQLERELEQ